MNETQMRWNEEREDTKNRIQWDNIRIEKLERDTIRTNLVIPRANEEAKLAKKLKDKSRRS